MNYKSVVCEFQIIYAVYSPRRFAVTYPVLSRTSYHERTSKCQETWWVSMLFTETSNYSF